MYLSPDSTRERKVRLCLTSNSSSVSQKPTHDFKVYGVYCNYIVPHKVIKPDVVLYMVEKWEFCLTEQCWNI